MDLSKVISRLRQFMDVFRKDHVQNVASDVLPLVLSQISDYRLIVSQIESEEDSLRFVEMIENAKAQQPDHGLAYAASAWLKGSENKPGEAIELVDKALELGPAEFRDKWHLERGLFYAQMGEAIGALKEMTKACWLRRGYGESHLRRMQLFSGLNDAASSVMEAYTAEYCEHPQKLDSICELMMKSPWFATPDRLEKTLRVLSNPTDENARQSRGRMMIELEFPKQALIDLYFVTMKNPRNLPVMALIEDIRENGLMATITIEEPEASDVPLMPEYVEIREKFKAHYQRYHALNAKSGLAGLWDKMLIRLGINSMTDQRKSALVSFLLGFGMLTFFHLIIWIIDKYLFISRSFVIPKGYTLDVELPVLRSISEGLRVFMNLMQIPLAYIAARSLVRLVPWKEKMEPEGSKNKLERISETELIYFGYFVGLCAILVLSDALVQIIIQSVKEFLNH